MLRRSILCFLFLLVLTPLVHASNPISLTKDTDATQIGSDYDILFDDAIALTIEDVAFGSAAGNFKPADQPKPHFSFTGTRVWVRFSLKNVESEKIQKIIALELQHALFVDLYQEREDGTFDRRQRGWLGSWSDADHRTQTPHFVVDLPPKSQQQFYLSVQADWVAIADINIYDPITFHTLETTLRLDYNTFSMTLFIFSFLHLFLFFMDRNRAHLYLSPFSFSCAMTLYVGSGNAAIYLPESLVFLCRYLYPLSAAASSFWGIVFVREFLKTKTDFPRINTLFNGILAASATTFFLALFSPAISMNLTSIVATSIVPIQLFATSLAVIKGHHPARIYLIGVVFMSFAGLIGLGVVWGLVDSNSVTASTSALSYIVLIVLGTVSVHVEDKEKEKEHRQRLQVLNQRLATTEERERQRIAKDLHDGVCQLLTSAKIEVSIIRDSLDDDSRRDQFNSGIDAISQAYEQARKVMYDLAPPVLQNLGLKAALEEALADLQTRFKINTTLSIQGEPFVLNLSFRSVFFRMTRELLMNVVKHAKAQSVHVDLAYETDSVSVVVKDDGVGFDTNKEAKASEVGSGLGLWSVRDQAQRLGGVFDVQSTPGEGAAVLLKLPIVKQEVLHDKAEE